MIAAPIRGCAGANRGLLLNGHVFGENENMLLLGPTAIFETCDKGIKIVLRDSYKSVQRTLGMCVRCGSPCGAASPVDTIAIAQAWNIPALRLVGTRDIAHHGINSCVEVVRIPLQRSVASRHRTIRYLRALVILEICRPNDASQFGIATSDVEVHGSLPAG